MPSIEKALNTGPSSFQLIVAGYTLAIGLVLVPAGRLGDLFGRRRLFVAGVALFATMSLGAGLANHQAVLAGFRLAQGVASGLLMPQVSGLIQQLFRGQERGRAFGYFGTTIGISTAIGPLLGGFIITAAGPVHGWRWVFWINVLVATAVVPLALKVLPKDRSRSGRTYLDAPGIVIIGLATITFMAPFAVSGSTSGLAASPHRWWLIALAASFAPVLYLWERRYHDRTGAAVVNPALAKNPSFLFGVALGMTYFAGISGIFVVMTLLMQSGLGYSALQAGAVMAPFAAFSAFSAWRSGRLVIRLGRLLVVGSLGVMIAGMVANNLVLRFVPSHHLWWAVTLALAVAGLGCGAVISPNQYLTLIKVPPAIGGVAGGMMQTGQRLGAAVGISVIMAIFFIDRLVHGVQAATANALLVSIGMMAVALAVAIADMRRHTN